MSVLSSLGPELLSAFIRELDLCGEELALPSAKTLGCVWDPDSDELCIDCSLKPLGNYTNRTMLSQLGQKFDPLGFGSPFFIKAYLILQQLATDTVLCKLIDSLEHFLKISVCVLIAHGFQMLL